jgi:hypothetical protein
MAKKPVDVQDKLTLMNVAGGGAEKQFQKALAKVLDSYEKGKEDTKNRRISLVFTISKDDEVLSFEAEVNAKIPAFRKIRGLAEVNTDGQVVNLTPPKQEDLFGDPGEDAGDGDDDCVRQFPSARG